MSDTTWVWIGVVIFFVLMLYWAVAQGIADRTGKYNWWTKPSKGIPNDLSRRSWIYSDSDPVHPTAWIVRPEQHEE